MKGAIASALGDFWGERNPREKKLVSVAAAMLAVAVLYSVLWDPAQTNRAQLRAQLPALQSKLARMNAEAQEARTLAGASQAVAPSGRALREALIASLTQRGLAPTHVNVAGSAVQFELKNAPFGTWIQWLDDMRKQFKVKVVEAHVTALKADGQVDVNATLQPASVK
jgi:general secretion pathway protein M